MMERARSAARRTSANAIADHFLASTGVPRGVEHVYRMIARLRPRLTVLESPRVSTPCVVRQTIIVPTGPIDRQKADALWCLAVVLLRLHDADESEADELVRLLS